MSEEEEIIIDGENEEELVDQVKTLIMKSNTDAIKKNRGYIVGMKENMKNIKLISNGVKKDRLENVSIITDIIGVMGASVQSWMSWCNPKTMNDITSDEMNELVKNMLKIMEDWINNDIDITEKVTKKLENSIKLEEIKKNYVV